MGVAYAICMYNFSTRAENREPSFQEVQTRVRVHRARCGEEVGAENCPCGGQLETRAQGTPGKFLSMPSEMLAVGTRPPESPLQAPGDRLGVSWPR